MLFVARFTDKPDIAEKRAELLQAHFDWLAANDDKVLLAGAMRNDAGEGLGGLWVIEADSKAEAEQVYQNDPFFANGLRAKVEVWHYVKAHPDKASVIRDSAP